MHVRVLLLLLLLLVLALIKCLRVMLDVGAAVSTIAISITAAVATKMRVVGNS